MSKPRRHERLFGEAGREGVQTFWEVVAEVAAPEGNNDAALRQIMADHPELRELPAHDLRVDVLCGRTWSASGCSVAPQDQDSSIGRRSLADSLREAWSDSDDRE